MFKNYKTLNYIFVSENLSFILNTLNNLKTIYVLLFNSTFFFFKYIYFVLILSILLDGKQVFPAIYFQKTASRLLTFKLEIMFITKFDLFEVSVFSAKDFASNETNGITIIQIYI